MFNFSTTTVINSPSQVRYVDYDPNDTTPEINGGIYIHGVGTLNAKNITAVSRKDAVTGSAPKVEIDLSILTGATNGDVFRLDLYVGLSQASAHSSYANDLSYKSKPFSVDFEWHTNASTTAEELVKTIKKYDLFTSGNVHLLVSSNNSIVTISGVDTHQKFNKLEVSRVKTAITDNPYDTIKLHKEFDLNSDNVTYTPNIEEFGTYNYILQNLRLPTSYNSSALGVGRVEAPVVGGEYTQFILEYTVNRGPLGTNAVGHHVTSVTLHVLWVNSKVVVHVLSVFNNVNVGGLDTTYINNVDEIIDDPESLKTSEPE